jgi:hypothetical protein
VSAIRERAQAAKARAEAATPADWIYGSILDGKRTIYARAEEEDGDNPVIAYDVPTADADFIVEAREDVPALADFALRVTDPGMRRRVASHIAAVLFGGGSALDLAERSADAALALLLGEPT